MKSSNITLHEKVYQVGGRVVPYRQTDMMKLLLAFRNFANAPKIPVKTDSWDNPTTRRSHSARP